MLPARNFPPPPKNDRRSEETDGQSSLSFNITADEGDANRTDDSRLAEGNTMSFLLDSGSNVHMTPHLGDLTEQKRINKKCTFGNNSHLQATVSGVIKLLVQENGKAMEVTIKDVLWVPELPCRLLSTRSLRRHGGEFVDSGIRKSHITLRKGGPKIE